MLTTNKPRTTRNHMKLLRLDIHVPTIQNATPEQRKALRACSKGLLAHPGNVRLMETIRKMIVNVSTIGEFSDKGVIFDLSRPKGMPLALIPVVLTDMIIYMIECKMEAKVDISFAA